MTTERKRYVMVPEWLIDHAEFTDEMRSAWLKLAGFMHQRWRSQRLTGEQACETLLSLDQLRLITSRTQVKVCLKFIRSLSEVCSKFDRISIEVEGNFFRVRWAKFAEMQRLGARKSGQVEPKEAPKSAPPVLLFPEPINPETQIRSVQLAQNGPAPARAAVGKGPAAVHSELRKNFQSGTVLLADVPRAIQKLWWKEVRGRVTAIYAMTLQPFAEARGFPWEDLDSMHADLREKTIGLMATVVMHRNMDFDVLELAQCGAWRSWEPYHTKHPNPEQMRLQFLPKTIFGTKFPDYYAEGARPQQQRFNLSDAEFGALSGIEQQKYLRAKHGRAEVLDESEK